MPVYAYKCDKCSYSFKMFHGVDEKPGKCARCNEDALSKQFPASTNIKPETSTDSAKRRVEKYIEETRESVRQQIEEARKEYIP